jgi:hypothetical protein
MATDVTGKGQAPLTKSGPWSGVRPGDGANLEADPAVKAAQAYASRLGDISRRRPFRGSSTEEIMRMTRGED